MFKLSELLQYNDIIIQCHDHPDADTISSAFGIYAYLSQNGKKPRILYAGFERIKKRNIQLMLKWLNLPVEYVQDAGSLTEPELLVCVDCQYGEGNVTRLQAKTVAVIDHHRPVSDKYDLGVIQPQLGSCATLVWDLLGKEGFDFSSDKDVSTSLYYGLLTDTNNFAEINHPLDRDMRDSLSLYCDNGMIRRLSLCNLTMEELEIAGVSLLRKHHDPEKLYALFKTEECDPNILGFISDIAMQVDTVDTCVVYSRRENGTKISVRSCSREVMASEFAEYITRGVGNGGGHKDKAGGWIQKAKIDDMGITIDEYIKNKTIEYFNSYDLIDASDHNLDTSAMALYRKLPIPRGFVVSTDAFEAGTPLMIRTIEADSRVKASDDIFLMIGVKGEAYPIKAEKFRQMYKPCDDPVCIDDDIYTPTVKNETTGETKELLPLMKSCISVGESPIYAKKLTQCTKVFTEWNPDGYMYGKVGDYLAVKCDDINDVYIINSGVFAHTYEAADK